MRSKYLLILALFPALLNAQVLNVYAWGGELPASLIQKFEAQTKIHVNYSTYDANETLYTKLKVSSNNVFDIILPSSYFVERMKKQNMLEKIDKKLLPNLKNLAPNFTNNGYDPYNAYSVPLIWGVTGIFYNQKWVSHPPNSWRELWSDKWRNKLLLLDDSREVFAIALLSLGLNPNTNDPQQIYRAFLQLKKLIPNIKLFASDNVQSILIDSDATLGSIWNGDAFKAQHENKNIEFIYPSDGFVIWVDCLAIPKNPPHRAAAYKFINFLLDPSNAKIIALEEGHAVTNKAAKNLTNAIVYPNKKILSRGYFQRDVNDEALKLYNYYWQKLKLSF